VGPGSVGVLQQIITGMCDAVEEVISGRRSFEAYPILVGLGGARPVRIPLDDAEGTTSTPWPPPSPTAPTAHLVNMTADTTRASTLE